jgi:hypothetical protein
MTYNLYIGLYLTQRQGTFLHQARWAKVQERRQHETLCAINLLEILNKRRKNYERLCFLPDN